MAITDTPAKSRGPQMGSANKGTKIIRNVQPGKRYSSGGMGFRGQVGPLTKAKPVKLPTPEKMGLKSIGQTFKPKVRIRRQYRKRSVKFTPGKTEF